MGCPSTTRPLPAPPWPTRTCAARPTTPNRRRRRMLTHRTMDRLHALHLKAMATALDQQRSSSQYAALSFDDRFGLLVETEWTAREQRKLAQRLRNAKPRYPSASLEDVDFATPRGLARDVVLSLGTGAWIREHHNLLISGPPGIGKSWLASAFVQSGCRHGFAAAYVRAPRLVHDLAVSRGDGSYARFLTKLAKLELLLSIRRAREAEYDELVQQAIVAPGGIVGGRR